VQAHQSKAAKEREAVFGAGVSGAGGATVQSNQKVRVLQSFIKIYLKLTSHNNSNCEELVIQGPESKQDLRVVNSYPSKVNHL
jgi:hypothetical protein